jgi:hypothetical protein
MAIWNKVLQKLNNNNTQQYEVVMMADKDGNIINTSGVASNISLAAGDISGYSYIEKFGSNLSVGANIETIWNNGGKYVYPTSAAVVYCDTVVADDGEDNAAGTGARTVTIQGLDASYHAVEETVTVGGAPSNTEFLRVNRAFVATAGSVGTNTKPILISTAANGIGTVLANIATHGTGSNEEGFGQTFLGLYTIPAGKTGYLTQWTMGANGTSAVNSYFRYRPYLNGNIFLTIDTMFFVNGHFTKDYSVPIKLDEKADVEVQAYNTATGVGVSTSFNIILVDNPS